MKRITNRVIAACFLVVLSIYAGCNKDESIIPTPDFVISDLVLINSEVIITDLPTFDLHGSLNFSGAINGVASLRVTSSLGMDATVPIPDIKQSSGQLVGVITITMIKVPGTYEFTLWLIDRSGRSSNKLTGSFTMIKDPNKLPTAVELTSVTWDDITKSPLITWTKNNDDNFQSYVIKRYRAGQDAQVIDRINDQDITSAHDPENHGTIGFNYSYSVEVRNQNVGVESNAVAFMHPSANLLYTGSLPYQQPEFTSTGNDMYFVNDPPGDYANALTLIDFSLETNSIRNRLDLSLQEMYGAYTKLSLGADDSRLSIVYSDFDKDSLMVFDARNFNVLLTKSLNYWVSTIACGKENRIYILPYSPAAIKGNILVLDAATGEQLGDMALADVKMDKFILSPDRNTLYAIGQPYTSLIPSGLIHIYKFDIRDNQMLLESSKRLANSVSGMEISPDGTTLLISQYYSASVYDHYIEFWDSYSMQKADQVNVPRMSHFMISQTFLFVVIDDASADYIKQFDLLTKSFVNTWEFSGVARFVPSKIKNSLYVFDANRKLWEVGLDTP